MRIQMRFASRSMSDTMCEEKTIDAPAVRRDLDELLEELAPRDRVEARDRLVENQEVGLVPEREQDRELLPLADRHALDARPHVDAPRPGRAAT